VAIGIIAVVFAVILGVSQCAAPDDRSEGAGPVPVSVAAAPRAG
jgi:hypothetical protein